MKTARKASACVGKQPIMVATAMTEHSYWLALAANRNDWLLANTSAFVSCGPSPHLSPSCPKICQSALLPQDYTLKKLGPPDIITMTCGNIIVLSINLIIDLISISAEYLINNSNFRSAI